MTGNCSASQRVLANSLRVVSAKRGNPPLAWLLLKSKIRTSWAVEEKDTLLLLNLENINFSVVQGTLENISVTYSITVMVTPSF